MAPTDVPCDDFMFKAYDIRAAADSITPELAMRLIHAQAIYFRENARTNTLVLCRDTRLSGARFLQSAAREFVRLGFDVVMNPLPVSTCQFYFMCMQFPRAAGIMFSASHNPGYYAGQKLVGPAVTPIAHEEGDTGGLDAIRRLYRAKKEAPARRGGSLVIVDMSQDFIHYSLGLARISSGGLSGLHIAVDYLNGAASPEISRGLQAAGATLHQRNFVPDGHFPAGDPNPLVRESIAPFVQELKENSYDFGFCFDGDGDRIDLFGPDASQISPSLNFAMVAPLLQERLGISGTQGSHVFLDFKAHPFAFDLMEEKHIGTHLVQNGHSVVKAALHAHASKGYFAAVEESAHYFMNLPLPGSSSGTCATENTLLIALLTAHRWLDSPAAYEELRTLQSRLYRQREWSYHFASYGQRQEALDAVIRVFRGRGLQSIYMSEEGLPLGGTLLRTGGRPRKKEPDSADAAWLQISQRVSESEDKLARWEVLAGSPVIRDEAVQLINTTVAPFVEKFL